MGERSGSPFRLGLVPPFAWAAHPLFKKGELIIRKATVNDLKYIEALRRKESEAIGFIPLQRYEMEIAGERKGAILVAEENTDLVGFIYATFGGLSAKIQQIAIQEDARRMERALALVNKIESIGNSRAFSQISCRCAEDLESNAFWEALGFIKVGVVDSKSVYGLGKEKWSRRGRKLNIYLRSPHGLELPLEIETKLKPNVFPRIIANTRAAHPLE